MEGFFREWAAAEERGDADFLGRALTDEFVGVGPLGFVLTKEQWLARFAGGLSCESFALEETEVRLYERVAVVTDRQKQSGSFQSNDVVGEFRATLVLVEGDGRWLLAGGHTRPIERECPRS